MLFIVSLAIFMLKKMSCVNPKKVVEDKDRNNNQKMQLPPSGCASAGRPSGPMGIIFSSKFSRPYDPLNAHKIMSSITHDIGQPNTEKSDEVSKDEGCSMM